MVESGNGARLVTSVPGRPTVLDNCGCTVLAVGASVFFPLSSPIISLSISTEILSQRAV